MRNVMPQEDSDSLIKELNEQLHQSQVAIIDIEKGCKRLSEDIIRKLCKRAIRKMNSKMSCVSWASSDDFPSSFNFIDVLSIEFQSKCFDEINPHLEEYIISSLDCELDKLPEIEKFIMCNLEHYEYGYDGLNCTINGVWDYFISMLTEHYSTVKISTYMLNRSF